MIDRLTSLENRPSGALPTYDVLGVGVSIVTPPLAVETLINWAQDDVGRFVCVRDAHGIMHARRDPDFLRLHEQAAMVTPDGRPVALLGKWRGLPVEQTCGPELQPAVMAASPQVGLRHYLYGGQDGVAQELATQMTARYPGLAVVGVETPPFRLIDDGELRELAERIRASGADIVWVGLSTPKQELLMQRLVPLVSATLIGVGAAFDFNIGRVARAPIWMRRLCLEGIYRLLMEPRRLWRRYLIMAPQFLVLALLQQARIKLGGGR